MNANDLRDPPTLAPGPGSYPVSDPACDAPPMGEHMRLFRKGFLYATASGGATLCRMSASVLMAASDQDFELSVAGGPPQRAALALLRPNTLRTLHALNVPYVCLEVYPTHPKFRTFTQVADPGVQFLPRGSVAGLDALVQDFYAHPNEPTPAYQLFRQGVDLLALRLPTPGPEDARVKRVIELVLAHPGSSVAQLAEGVHLSPDRLSHLFSHELGITLRKYMQGLKITEAAKYYHSGLSLKEIAMASGFSDASHFSKVWMQAFGLPPTHFFSSGEISVVPK